MFQLHSAKSPIDPSFFLKSLKDAFIREGRSSFDLHTQQDVVEVLEILLQELTGPSIITSAAYNTKSLTSSIWVDFYEEWIFIGKEEARFEVVHELPCISREESAVIKNGG